MLNDEKPFIEESESRGSMNEKARLTTDKKQCPYCNNNNVTYLGYSTLRSNPKIDGDDSKEKTHDFKCEDCKRIFYYLGPL